MKKILFYPLRPLIALLCYTAFSARQCGVSFGQENTMTYEYRARTYSPVYWLLVLIAVIGMAAIGGALGIIETFREVRRDLSGKPSNLWKSTQVNQGGGRFAHFLQIYCPQ